MDPKQLSNHIIESAETTEGTWTVQFLNEVADSCRNFSQKQIDSFVHLLLTDSKWEAMENPAKLKIAQLLVSLRSFFFPSINMSIIKEKAAISHCANSVKNGKIADATRKMLNGLLTPVAGAMHMKAIPPPRQRIHSMSVQPKERSIPITPPPNQEEELQQGQEFGKIPVIDSLPKMFSLMK